MKWMLTTDRQWTIIASMDQAPLCGEEDSDANLRVAETLRQRALTGKCGRAGFSLLFPPETRFPQVNMRRRRYRAWAWRWCFLACSGDMCQPQSSQAGALT